MDIAMVELRHHHSALLPQVSHANPAPRPQSRPAVPSRDSSGALHLCLPSFPEPWRQFCSLGLRQKASKQGTRGQAKLVAHPKSAQRADDSAKMTATTSGRHQPASAREQPTPAPRADWPSLPTRALHPARPVSKRWPRRAVLICFRCAGVCWGLGRVGLPPGSTRAHPSCPPGLRAAPPGTALGCADDGIAEALARRLDPRVLCSFPSAGSRAHQIGPRRCCASVWGSAPPFPPSPNPEHRRQGSGLQQLPCPWLRRCLAFVVPMGLFVPGGPAVSFLLCCSGILSVEQSTSTPLRVCDHKDVVLRDGDAPQLRVCKLAASLLEAGKRTIGIIGPGPACVSVRLAAAPPSRPRTASVSGRYSSALDCFVRLKESLLEARGLHPRAHHVSALFRPLCFPPMPRAFPGIWIFRQSAVGRPGRQP